MIAVSEILAEVPAVSPLTGKPCLKIYMDTLDGRFTKKWRAGFHASDYPAQNVLTIYTDPGYEAYNAALYARYVKSVWTAADGRKLATVDYKERERHGNRFLVPVDFIPKTEVDEPAVDEFLAAVEDHIAWRKPTGKILVHEVKDILDGMTVVVDSRERPEHRLYKLRLEQLGRHEIRDLETGDYTWSAETPVGKISGDLICTVERKSGANELVHNLLSGDLARFRRECQRARDSVKRLVFLIEDPDFKDDLPLEALNRLRYLEDFSGAVVKTCMPYKTGAVIKDTLKRSLENHLLGLLYDPSRN